MNTGAKLQDIKEPTEATTGSEGEDPMSDLPSELQEMGCN